MNKILDEMGAKWQSLNKDQQVALAQAVAGTRQYSQLIALMDNYGTFQDNIQVAINSTGTLEKQQATYLESTAAHLEKLSAASERLMGSLFDTDSVNGLIDGLTDVVNLLSNFIESVGGGKNALLMFGSIGTQVFSSQIAQGLHNLTLNFMKGRLAVDDFRTSIENLKTITENNTFDDKITEQVVQYKQLMNEYGSLLNKEEQEEGNRYLQQYQQTSQAIKDLDESYKKAYNDLQILTLGQPVEDLEKLTVDDIFENASDEDLHRLANNVTLDMKRIRDIIFKEDA